MLVFILLIVMGMAGWVTGIAPSIQKQQDVAYYCKDWITLGCGSDESVLSDPRFVETEDRPGLLNTCASVVGKSPDEFPDEINPEADWDKCRAKCPGCPKKSEEPEQVK